MLWENIATTPTTTERAKKEWKLLTKVSEKYIKIFNACTMYMVRWYIMTLILKHTDTDTHITPARA